MIQTQRLTAALTPLDAALGLLCSGLTPVEPTHVPVAGAVGCIAAAMPPLQQELPAFSIAVANGWALRARDLVGASSYSPLPLAAPPVWVEAGDRLPNDCDCVLDSDLVEQAGPMFQVVAEATPGQGVRRAGEDLAAGCSVIPEGRRISAFDVLAARAAGLDRLQIRSPRVRVIDVSSTDGNAASWQFISEFVNAAGARVISSHAGGRDAASISAVIDADPCDFLVLVGGTGVGRTDATIQALAARGALLAHGLALQPGRTTAIGKIGATPVIAVPGAPDQALAVCLMLVQPVLDRLAARTPQREITRPLARKISSAIGVAEMVLLKMSDEVWMPLAAGQLFLDAIASADAWLVVPADSEGYATGTPVGAFPLREFS